MLIELYLISQLAAELKGMPEADPLLLALKIVVKVAAFASLSSGILALITNIRDDGPGQVFLLAAYGVAALGVYIYLWFVLPSEIMLWLTATLVLMFLLTKR